MKAIVNTDKLPLVQASFSPIDLLSFLGYFDIVIYRFLNFEVFHHFEDNIGSHYLGLRCDLRLSIHLSPKEYGSFVYVRDAPLLSLHCRGITLHLCLLKHKVYFTVVENVKFVSDYTLEDLVSFPVVVGN